MAPNQVILFSGHMIDAAKRATPRFPPSAEPQAGAAITKALEDLRVGAGDLGITEGACGGDLLFCEALLACGASLELRLPFGEPEFIERSVAFAKQSPPPDRWLERFDAVARHPRVTVRAMPDEMGELPRVPAGVPAADRPYVQCNLWMLRDTLGHGAARASVVLLWNGGGGDSLGGTEDMKKNAEAAGARVVWLDTRKLWRA